MEHSLYSDDLNAGLIPLANESLQNSEATSVPDFLELGNGLGKCFRKSEEANTLNTFYRSRDVNILSSSHTILVCQVFTSFADSPHGVFVDHQHLHPFPQTLTQTFPKSRSSTIKRYRQDGLWKHECAGPPA